MPDRNSTVHIKRKNMLSLFFFTKRDRSTVLAALMVGSQH
jgi:hypothetical protein